MDDNKLVPTSDNEFMKKVDPVELKETDDLFLFKCSECGGVHFRHAGYVEVLMPYMKGDKSKNVLADSFCVKVCVKCRRCYVWIDNQMYDATKIIDLEAWEKFEQESYKATGPGGEC